MVITNIFRKTDALYVAYAGKNKGQALSEEPSLRSLANGVKCLWVRNSLVGQFPLNGDRVVCCIRSSANFGGLFTHYKVAISLTEVFGHQS